MTDDMKNSLIRTALGTSIAGLMGVVALGAFGSRVYEDHSDMAKTLADIQAQVYVTATATSGINENLVDGIAQVAQVRAEQESLNARIIEIRTICK